jgi:hypothetical protein
VEAELEARLTPAQRTILQWYEAQAGTEGYFPERLDGGVLVTSRPKGIYKPQGLEYAVSVRINRESRYSDGEVFVRQDDTWFFSYHQENPDPALRDHEYTNVALMASMREGFPVGVLREVAPSRGRSRYAVLGLAYVIRWDAGYFFLDSAGPQGLSGTYIVEEVLAATALAEAEGGGEVEPPPGDEYDARLRTYRRIVARQGQRAFRQKLLDAYSARCAVTGCSATAVLEAAHLRPYRGPESNAISNGILLRADLHTLLDLQLLAIHPDKRTLIVSGQLTGTEYAGLDGRRLAQPSPAQVEPDEGALRSLWAAFESAEEDRQGHG